VPEGSEKRIVIGRCDVLTEIQDALVARHLQVDRLSDRGDIGHFTCHALQLLGVDVVDGLFRLG